MLFCGPGSFPGHGGHVGSIYVLEMRIFLQQREFEIAVLHLNTRRRRGVVRLNQTRTNQADALGLLSLIRAACLDVA